jgi:CheY-like chemotaxis protein
MVVLDKRVLVVDDEQIVRDSCERALKDAGYAVRTVGNGYDALEACRAERFDVMFTDLKMPGMQGLDVIRKVTEECPETRVIIITGYPSQESALQAGRLGVFDYLEKPLSPERLSAATHSALTQAPPRRTTAEDSETATNTRSPLPETEPRQELQQDVETDDEPSPAVIDSVAEAPISEQLHETGPDEAVESPVSVLKVLGLLAVAPLIGLAYVVFMPLIGFVMLFAAIASGLASKSG